MINKASYFTATAHGITQYQNGLVKKFINADEFIFQKEAFRKIKQIHFFQKFKLMKIARILKFNSLKGRRLNAQESLKKNLFLSDK